ncbi:MAG: Tim44/TimA family putative adaptor protein [Devosia sp.]
MSEFSLLDWILTIAALFVSWQIHTAVLHQASGAATAQPQAEPGSREPPPPAAPAGSLEERLERIRRAGGYPDLPTFLKGAGLAYEQIIAAFAAGELQPVRELLGPAVREGLSTAIAERQARGETHAVMLIGADPMATDAGLDAGTAWIEVCFHTEMVATTTDEAGRVLTGDPRRIVEGSETWTFARDVHSPDPNWLLVATDGEA